MPMAVDLRYPLVWIRAQSGELFVYESLVDEKDHARIRARNDDSGIGDKAFYARRPLVDAGVDYSAGEVENLSSARPEAGGVLDRDLADSFRSQRRAPAIWDALHEQEREKQSRARKGAIHSKYAGGGVLDLNPGKTPAEQVRLAQEAQDRLDADGDRENPFAQFEAPRNPSAADYRKVQQNQWLQAKLASSGQQREQVEAMGADMFDRHARGEQQEQRIAQENADEAAYQEVNRGVPSGFSASRRAPAVPAMKGARARRIRAAADTGDGTEPSASTLKSARKGLLAGMSKEDSSAWRRMEDQQKLPRRVGFSQERSVPFDWRDKPHEIAADLASDDVVRDQPRSQLDKLFGIPRQTNERTRSLAKPSNVERYRAVADARAEDFNARMNSSGAERQRDLDEFVESLSPRERRDNAYFNDFTSGSGSSFMHSTRGMEGLTSDFMRAKRVADRGGDGADEAQADMNIITSSEKDQGNIERQAKALGYGDAGRGVLGYRVGSSQYLGKEGRAKAIAANVGSTQGMIVERANAKRGIFSRMLDTVARWMPGLGRLFGQGRDARFSAAPGQEANRALANQGRDRRRGDQRAAPMFSMSRLFGVTPRTRPLPARSPQIAAENISPSAPGSSVLANGAIAPPLIENGDSSQPVGLERDVIDDGASMEQFGSEGGEPPSDDGFMPLPAENDPKPLESDPRFDVADGGGGMNYVSPDQQAHDAWEKRNPRR